MPKAFWKVTVLSLAFPGDVCGFGGGDSVVSGMGGVTGNMGCCGGVAGCTRGGAGRRMVGVTSGGVGGKCGSTDLAEFYLTARPSPPCFYRFPWPVISRAFFLEIRKYVLCAVGSPEYQ